jgi:hypothetical protein
MDFIQYEKRQGDVLKGVPTGMDTQEPGTQGQDQQSVQRRSASKLVRWAAVAQ